VAAARKATMSVFAITQLMPSCEAVQTQLLSLYIIWRNRAHVRTEWFPSYKGHILWACLVRIYSSFGLNSGPIKRREATLDGSLKFTDS